MEKYAFFDVDRTIRKGSAALDFCDYLLARGLVNDSFRTKDSEVRTAYKAGVIDYQGMVEGVVRIHGTVLTGLDVEQLVNEYDGYIQETHALFDWTEDLFKLLKDNNFRTVLVSAGISPAIEAIGRHLGVSHIFASLPEIREGRYTGTVTRILHDVDKHELVKGYISDLGSDRSTLGFGDSTGDTLMLELMDHAIIFNPHQEEMYKVALEHNWQVVKNRDGMFSAVGELVRQ